MCVCVCVCVCVTEHLQSNVCWVRVAHTPGREEFERLTVLGSEPGDPPVYIPRVPCIAFPDHVNTDDGRLIDPARARGQGRTPRTSSRSSAPETPPPARPPPRPDGSQAIPAPRGSRGQAVGEGPHNVRNGPRGGGRGDPESSGGRSNGNDRERGDRAHGVGPRGGREQEQGEDHLMRGHVTVLGEAMRRMVEDPTLQQIFLGGYGGAPRVEAGAHGADPPALRATRGDEARNTGHGSGGGSRRDRECRRGDDIAAARGAAIMADATIASTITSHTAETGLTRGVKLPRPDSPAMRPLPRPSGSPLVARRTGAGPAGGTMWPGDRAAARFTRAREDPHGSTLGLHPLRPAVTP